MEKVSAHTQNQHRLPRLPTQRSRRKCLSILQWMRLVERDGIAKSVFQGMARAPAKLRLGPRRVEPAVPERDVDNFRRELARWLPPRRRPGRDAESRLQGTRDHAIDWLSLNTRRDTAEQLAVREVFGGQDVPTAGLALLRRQHVTLDHVHHRDHGVPSSRSRTELRLPKAMNQGAGIPPDIAHTEYRRRVHHNHVLATLHRLPNLDFREMLRPHVTYPTQAHGERGSLIQDLVGAVRQPHCGGGTRVHHAFHLGSAGGPQDISRAQDVGAVHEVIVGAAVGNNPGGVEHELTSCHATGEVDLVGEVAAVHFDSGRVDEWMELVAANQQSWSPAFLENPGGQSSPEHSGGPRDEYTLTVHTGSCRAARSPAPQTSIFAEGGSNGTSNPDFTRSRAESRRVCRSVKRGAQPRTLDAREEL